MDILTSIHGKRMGLAKDGSLVLNHGDDQNIIPASRTVNVTAATLTLTHDDHAGRIVTLNRAAGITVTLPDATGSGDVYEIFVGTTVTSNSYVIQAPDADNIIQGVIGVATDAAGVNIPTASTTDTITMSGSTTGGIKGSYVRLVDVAADTWMVSGSLVSSGAEATPFSAAVS